MISCGARLAVFDIAELREVTAYDELELDTLGDRKTALFLIMSDTDDSFNFLISMCYTQLFNLLCEKADDVYGGRLPVHVRCLIDECANIGQIPKLEKLVATIRSREISACLVLQAQSQLKAIYKDNADTIIGNMDTSIFLGGKEPTTLIANTKGEGKAGDDFWVKAETLLYCALIGYIHYEAPVEEQNFSTLIEFLNAMEVREDDEEFQNPVDLMFEALEKKKPNHFAVRQYKKYKLAAGKTAKSILISCGARLAPFDIQEVRDVTAYDELQLDTLGDKKTALFLIMSDTDSTFNFLISMIYTQLFNLLCEKADDVYGGRLPVHVRCLIDEAANIGQIPNLEKLVATIRSREISACLVLQAQSQLKAIYKDNADTIIGNMDSRIFLGGSEPTTLKELNQALGKETIDTFNTSNTRGNSPSYGMNYQKLGKDLASVDELAVLDGSKCILQLRGVRPFLSDKYDLTQHPNFKLTADYDKRNEFKIEEFLSHRLRLKADDEFVVVDAD